MRKFILGFFLGIIFSAFVVYFLQEWQTQQVIKEMEAYSKKQTKEER